MNRNPMGVSISQWHIPMPIGSHNEHAHIGDLMSFVEYDLANTEQGWIHRVKYANSEGFGVSPNWCGLYASQDEAREAAIDMLLHFMRHDPGTRASTAKGRQEAHGFIVKLGELRMEKAQPSLFEEVA